MESRDFVGVASGPHEPGLSIPQFAKTSQARFYNPFALGAGAARAREADGDIGTARLVALAHREIAFGMSLIPNDRICAGQNALRIVCKWRGKLSRKAALGRAILPSWKADGERGNDRSLEDCRRAQVPLDLMHEEIA